MAAREKSLLTKAVAVLVISVKRLLACPCGPSIQTVSVKKTKHLELSEKFWLCVKKYLIKFLSNFSSIRKKNLNTLNSQLIACPSGPTIQTVSVKKTKHLELLFYLDTSGT